MNSWIKLQIGKAISFNPPESISKGKVAKKIPMGNLTEYQRKINSFELNSYNSGPKFRNGDTIMAKITPCLENGKTAFVDVLDEDEVAFGSTEYIVLRETEYTDSLFIYYLAISPTFRKKAISCMEGTSGRKRVSEKTLKNFELNFPPLQTQKQIAKVLSELDTKIEVNNKINQDLEAMAKLLYDYWFVQFDFPDANGKPYKLSGGKMVYNEELKREIPEGWELKRLKKEMNVQYGYPFSTELFSEDNNGKPVVRIRNILKNTISTYSSEEVDVRYKLERGDLLIGMDGNFHINFWDKENCWLNQRSLRIRGNINSTVSTYQAYLDIKPFIEAREKNVSRTTVAHLSAKDVDGLNILVAPETKTFKHKETFDSFVKKIIANRNENQQLTELRDWLLPMLMNGQVAVGEAAAQLGMVAEDKQTYRN